MGDVDDLGDRGILWCVEGGAAELLGPGGPSVRAWLREGRAEVVKHGPHRTVYRVRLPDLLVYWKRCRLAGPRSWLRQLLRPPKARMEFDKARALRARGVPTVEPLAWGVRHRRWPGESYLLTRGLEHAAPLNQFLEAELPKLPGAARARLRQRLAEALGAFFARLHDAGVTHPDPHPGNVLVERSPDGGLGFYLLDLHAIGLGGPLSWPAARDNLVLFNRWASLRAGRADRCRFWHSYRRHRRTGVLPDTPVAVRELEERTAASNRRFWRSRDRRCLKTNRYFRRVRSPAAVGHAVRDLPEEVLARLLADPDAPFREPGVKLLKDSRSSTVAEWVIDTPGGPRPVVYKRFRVTGRWEPLKNLLRRPPALHSWAMGHALRDRGLPTPRPLLVLHRRKCGLRHEGYLLAEKVEGASDLHAAAAALAALPPAQRLACKRGAIETVARLLRELHRRSLSHRDLKAANILLAPNPAGAPGPAARLIDLAGARDARRLTPGRRARDLARLSASFLGSPQVTRSDRLRFLRAYLGTGLHGPEGWKAWWRAIDAATRAKAGRNRRRGRPLA